MEITLVHMINGSPISPKPSEISQCVDQYFSHWFAFLFTRIKSPIKSSLDKRDLINRRSLTYQIVLISKDIFFGVGH